MHTLFGITLVLYLLKLSVGQGIYQPPKPGVLDDRGILVFISISTSQQLL